jgi:hypothetical protein
MACARETRRRHRTFCWLEFARQATNSISSRSNRFSRMNDPDPYILILPANNLRGANDFAGCRKEPMSKRFKRASAGLSLVVLALGFSLLGVFSFLNRLQGELAIMSAVEQNCCVAGSAASVFTGSVFFLAACMYWRR